MTTTVNLQNTGEQTRTTEPDGGANLDKVRDLLFGGQMRDYDRKFARLEERLVKETAELRDDVKKRLAAIEALLEPRSSPERAPASRAGRPRRTRSRTWPGSSTTPRRTFEKKVGAARRPDRARSARAAPAAARAASAARPTTCSSRSTRSWSGSRASRRSCARDKTDRAALAALLTEMAMRLTDDFRLPSPRSERAWLDAAAARQGDVPAGPRDHAGRRHSPSCARCSSGRSSGSCGRCRRGSTTPAAQARDVSRVLPQAIAAAQGRSAADARARADGRRSASPRRSAAIPGRWPTRCSRSSVPPIRKAIAASLSGMLESLNRTLEHSLSWRAVQWRLTRAAHRASRSPRSCSSTRWSTASSRCS